MKKKEEKKQLTTIRFVVCETIEVLFRKFSEKFRNRIHWWKTLKLNTMDVLIIDERLCGLSYWSVQ